MIILAEVKSWKRKLEIALVNYKKDFPKTIHSAISTLINFVANAMKKYRIRHRFSCLQ